jgi:hypothetical protein
MLTSFAETELFFSVSVDFLAKKTNICFTLLGDDKNVY